MGNNLHLLNKKTNSFPLNTKSINTLDMDYIYENISPPSDLIDVELEKINEKRPSSEKPIKIFDKKLKYQCHHCEDYIKKKRLLFCKNDICKTSFCQKCFKILNVIII
jgi:hypothetical protein